VGPVCKRGRDIYSVFCNSEHNLIPKNTNLNSREASSSISVSLSIRFVHLTALAIAVRQVVSETRLS
jgi:hypothetical protein